MSALNRLMIPPDPGTILAPVAVTERDNHSRDAILFLHGLGCSRTMWEPVMDMADDIDARASKFMLYAIDFPGHGDSPESCNRIGIIEALLHLQHALRCIDADRFHLVAHSMATAIIGYAIGYAGPQAQRWRQQYKIASILSLEGNLIREDCGLITSRIYDEGFDRFVLWGGHASIADQLEQTGLVTNAAWARQWRRSSPRRVWNLADEIVKTSWHGHCDYWEHFGARAYLYGQHSDIPDATRAIVSDAPTFMIKDADHFPMVINPEGTLKAVLDAIDTLHPNGN